MSRLSLIGLVVCFSSPALATAPHRQFTLALPSDALMQPFSMTTPAPTRQSLEPAPLPNRDLNGPTSPRASNAPTVAPTLFTTREQYRGDGFSRGSTAQGEQERNVKPPVGFSLHMPLAPQ